ncbi:MAG: diguanylate cyclase [Sphingomonadales bacterium]|nr:diguanylate cyclase [Sphingomonadales bacterium]
MGVDFTVLERCALYGMLADNSTDIIIKSDARGFIVSASPALAGLGVNLPGLLFGPHIRDLVQPSYADALEAEHRAVLAGRGDGRWHEFPGLGSGDHPEWFEVRMSRLCADDSQAYGVLGVMRSVTARKSLEERLFAAELTDPLTGLTNRIAFTTMLDYLVDNDATGCLALFDLDHFMALNMTWGQVAGDDMLCAFAGMLRDLCRREDILSRVGAERFAVLMPRVDPDHARALCQPVIDTLAALGRGARQADLAVTASAGIAPIAGSVDATLKRAEISLFLAKAKGRSRVETWSADHPPSPFESGIRDGNFLASPPRFA